MASNGLARLALIAAIVGGVSYIAAWGMDLPLWLDAAWKGSCVGLLAVYAALQARSTDGWLIAGSWPWAWVATSCWRSPACRSARCRS